MKNTQILLENGISDLSFSKNGAYCAIATKKDSNVHVYEIKTLNDINTWKQLQVFKEHMQTVSSIDWAQDDKIITASHDRSAFVWKKNGQKWDKMLVNIDVKLAVMTAKWAPNSRKFALGSCPSTITFGFYNSEAKCWTAVAKQKLLKAPVTSLDFHPSSNLLAVGSVDSSVKIISCSFKKSSDPNIIQSKVDDGDTYKGPFEKIDSLWEVLFSIDNISPKLNSWINHVSFENNGAQLLVLPHSRHIKVFDLQQGKILTNERDIEHNGLPFMNGYVSNEKQQLLLAGFDKTVSVFTKSGDSYKFSSNLSKNQKSNKSVRKGIVEAMMKGIQKKQWTLGDAPKQEEHMNTTMVKLCRKTPVSFDLNGIVHFWQ